MSLQLGYGGGSMYDDKEGVTSNAMNHVDERKPDNTGNSVDDINGRGLVGRHDVERMPS